MLQENKKLAVAVCTFTCPSLAFCSEAVGRKSKEAIRGGIPALGSLRGHLYTEETGGWKSFLNLLFLIKCFLLPQCHLEEANQHAQELLQATHEPTMAGMQRLCLMLLLEASVWDTASC